MADHGEATDHRQFADLHELMDGDVSRQYRFATDCHVSAEQNAVDQYRFVSDGTIVANMSPCHHEATLADASRGIGGGSAMDGHVFSQCCTVANAAMTDRSTKREILWKITNNTTGMNAAVASDVRVAEQMNVGTHRRISPNMHRPVDHAIRTNFGSGIDHSIGVDNCGRMNRHQDALETGICANAN